MWRTSMHVIVQQLDDAIAPYIFMTYGELEDASVGRV